MSNLLGAPLVDGNAVTELLNGDEIFGSMLEAIRSAKTTITIEKYIWSSGVVSTQFVAALSDRARAGVKVHILVDAVGSAKFGTDEVDALAEAGAQFANYNPPLSFKMLRANHRTHRKLMVVDGRIGFIGGVCISDDWAGDAEPGRWRDTHLRVEGPVVNQMQAVFAENWLQTTSEVLHGEDYFPVVQSAGSIMAQCFKSGPGEGTDTAQLLYLLSIAAAERNIRLAHSYFVPNDLTVNALLDARRRGVEIEVIVPENIDHFAVEKAARSRWGQLLKAGVQFYEYEPTLYHCKIMIVDDIWSTVGSVNFDERSFRINDEANLNVFDRGFAAKLIETFEADLSQSRLLTHEDFKERNWFQKATDHFMGLFQSQL
jgi:cardiolipin synthase